MGGQAIPDNNVAASVVRLRTGTVIAYLILGGIVALSSILPWVHVLWVERSGLDIYFGWPVLVAGGLSAAMAGLSLHQGRAVDRLRLAQFASGVTAMAMFAITYALISSACDDATSSRDWYLTSSADSGSCTGSILGVGAVVALLAGALQGGVALFRRPAN